MRRLALTLPLLFAVTSLSAGCTDEETPFNEIDRLRVLGIRSSLPWLQEGETTTLDFLSVNNDPTIDDSDLRNRWSFCPIQADSTLGFECVIQSADDLRTFTGTATLPVTLELAEFGEFGVLIGTDDSVTLPFALPSELINQVCEALDTVELPPFVTRPQCNGLFPVTVFLEHGAALAAGTDPNAIDPTRRIVSFRDVDLLYDATLETNPPNTNPEIASLSIASRTNNVFIPTSTSAPVVLKFDTTYDLRIDVTPEQSEFFEPDDDDEPNRESLTVTWFIEGGSTDFERTGFLPADDGDSFDDLIENEWTTPKRADFGDRRDARMFLVIRDGRGGLTWIIRDFEFDDADGL